MTINISKRTYFIDIDGTILHNKTEEPLEQAVEKINKAKENGHFIILTTFRGENWDVTNRFSKVSTLRLLKVIKLKYDHIIWDSPSPRIIINDETCLAYQHPCNENWKDVEL